MIVPIKNGIIYEWKYCNFIYELIWYLHVLLNKLSFYILLMIELYRNLRGLYRCIASIFIGSARCITLLILILMWRIHLVFVILFLIQSLLLSLNKVPSKIVKSQRNTQQSTQVSKLKTKFQTFIEKIKVQAFAK